MSSGQAVVVINKTISEGESAAFAYRDEYGLIAEGFVFRRNGVLHAYRNQCRHRPLTLDYGDGELFTEDRRYLLCRNHGALYEPETGLCIAGPCTGASLFRLHAIGSGAGIEIFAPPENADIELE
ncbi:MAG: Rieske (2Fe-2S) protein [Candidatus Sumerlaeaceae bacterium]